MPFDPKFKERARANDAVDRLRELKQRLEGDEVRRQERHDLAVRATLVVLIVLLVGYAIIHQ